MKTGGHIGDTVFVIVNGNICFIARAFLYIFRNSNARCVVFLCFGDGVLCTCRNALKLNALTVLEIEGSCDITAFIGSELLTVSVTVVVFGIGGLHISFGIDRGRALFGLCKESVSTAVNGYLSALGVDDAYIEFEILVP